MTGDRDIKILITVRAYDAEPEEVLAKLGTMPADISWYTTENGEFEIIDAEQPRAEAELAVLRMRLEAFAAGLERHHARGGRSAVALAKLNMSHMIREILEES